MKKKGITLILWISIACLVFSASKSENDFYINIKKHTDAYTYRGEVIPAKTENIEWWIGTNIMTYINGEKMYIVDLNKKQMILINSKYKTYVEAVLPLKLPSILNDLALLRWETSQQTTGSVSKSDESKMIKEWPCIRFDVKKKGSDESDSTVWATTAVPFDLEVFNKMMREVGTFLNFNYSDKLNEESVKINGFPIFIEEMKARRGARIRSTVEVVEISKKLPPANAYIHSVPAHYLKKETISYEELRTASPGPPKKELSKTGKEIFSVLGKLQEGYIRRDTSIVEKWVKDLFTEDVYIIGTNATYPGSFEWRKGHEAAVQMFSNDWRRWGDLKMYIDEADISVENKSAWIAMFATVTKKPGQGPSRYRDAETSRKGSLARIREMTGSESSSVLALYEIIHDASMVLVQYERSHEFTWPLRMTFGMVKKRGKWLVKQLHWSLPGRGFPVVRLLKNEN